MNTAWYEEIRSLCEIFAKTLKEKYDRDFINSVSEKLRGIIDELHGGNLTQEKHIGRKNRRSNEQGIGDLPSTHGNDSVNVLDQEIEDFAHKIAFCVGNHIDKERHIERAALSKCKANMTRDYQQKISQIQKQEQIENEKIRRKMEEIKEGIELERRSLIREITTLKSRNQVLEAKISRFKLMANQLSMDE